ncbi:prolyl oligopeptidase family serine peptidase [Novosphingobium sp.]|uniref:alpha/beta hydrolase family protein n=1 Tax=Novosphingobium sp. TaxID=1874826 RepID=UPI0025E60BC8|nr:prolyl oligopeptidase family serine peptidase [Novosphingobium sp.]MCC6925990.1 S9 family peptidase [Novosphingobium sp.]
MLKTKIFSCGLAAITLSFALAAAAPAQQAKTDLVVTGIKGRVPTEVFGKRPFMRSPQISPDGTKIAVMMSRNGVDNLGIIDLTKPGSPPKFFVRAEEFREAGDRTVGSWNWVGNRTVIFTLASREHIFGQLRDLRRLVAYDLESGKLTPLAWEDASTDAGDVIHRDHKKETILLQRRSLRNKQMEFDPEVVSVDVRTGKFTTVVRPNVLVDDWIPDGNGVIRVGLGSSEDGKQRLMYRSNENEQFKTISNEKDTTYTGAQIVPEIFTKEPDIVYATSNRDNYRRVYRFNIKTMEVVGNPVFQVPGYDVGDLVASKDGSRLIGVRYTSNKERTKWFDPRLAEIQKFFDEDFGVGDAQILSTSEDETKLTLHVGKTSDPGAYYLFDTVSGKLTVLGYYHPELKDAQMNPTETVRYKASDGLEIEAIITYPRHRPHRKNLPVIVMPHGGPFGVRDQEEFGFFPWHQSMAELGYVVIQPNYRGSGGYGRDFVKEGRKSNGYGLRMQDDLNDALTWFGQKGLIDPSRACIMGWSYGGYATARGAQRDPKLWKCAIAGAGVYDFPMMKAYDTDQFGSFGASYQATSDNLVAISSARNTDGPWSPILILAAERDARIPMSQSKTLVSRLKGSGKVEGKDFRYVVQPKGTHNLPYEDVHIEWLVEAEKWSDRFNPAYIPSDVDYATKPAIDPRFQSGASAAKR